MMDRGLGAMFYGRRPVQYMRNGGVSSGRGSYAGYDPVAAATGRATSSQPAQVTREPAAYTSTRTAAATPAREAAQVTREPSSYESMQSRESAADRREAAALQQAYQQAASTMREAGVTGLGQTIPAFDMPGELRERTFGGAGGGFGERFPDLTRDAPVVSAAVSGPSAGLSRPAYGDVAPVAPYVSLVASRPDISSLLSNVPTAGLSQPAYAGVSPISYGPSGTSGTSGSQTAASPVETLLGGKTAAGQIAVPPPRPTEPGFFQGLGSALMSLPGAIMNDIAMGWTLATQGEEAFIEKYGADALADYRQRTAETAARTAAEEAARGDDSDVFEACPEGYERDPVTQMCVPVPVKGIEEEEEEETTTTTTTGPTPGSGETIQEVIDRITVTPSGSSLPNVDFFGVQRGPRRMQEGGAVDYRAAARAEAEKFGLRPDMFERMILRESNFDPMARSPKGALGLAQVMPATARDPGFGVAPLANPMDPNESLRFGAEYLSALLREFGGDEERALAAYNAGVGRVRAAGGVPDIAETRDYVDFILRGRGPVEAPPPRPADLGKKAGPSKAAVSRAVAALTPERRASVPVPPMPSRPSMSREERMSQLQGGMGGGDSLSRAVDSVLSSLMR